LHCITLAEDRQGATEENDGEQIERHPRQAGNSAERDEDGRAETALVENRLVEDESGAEAAETENHDYENEHDSAGRRKADLKGEAEQEIHEDVPRLSSKEVKKTPEGTLDGRIFESHGRDHEILEDGIHQGNQEPSAKDNAVQWQDVFDHDKGIGGDSLRRKPAQRQVKMKNQRAGSRCQQKQETQRDQNREAEIAPRLSGVGRPGQAHASMALHHHVEQREAQTAPQPAEDNPEGEPNRTEQQDNSNYPWRAVERSRVRRVQPGHRPGRDQGEYHSVDENGDAHAVHPWLCECTNQGHLHQKPEAKGRSLTRLPSRRKQYGARAAECWCDCIERGPRVHGGFVFLGESR
jgi:hypothetical protein